MTAAPLANAGVRFPPPLLFVLGLLAGWCLSRLGPGLRLADELSTVLRMAGLLLIAAGFGLAAWGMITFKRARTAIIPNRSATAIVTTGPYRFTRNPMYLGMTLAYLGGALLIGTVWTLLLLPAVIAILYRRVIRREEAYLDAAFPDVYAEYRGRVRRWL